MISKTKKLLTCRFGRQTKRLVFNCETPDGQGRCENESPQARKSPEAILDPANNALRKVETARQREKIEQVLDAMAKNGLQNVRCEMVKEEKYKRNERERTEPNVPRYELPKDHPDNETITIETPVFHFNYRGIKGDFRYEKRENGDVYLFANDGEHGHIIRAADMASAIINLKQRFENEDPNYAKELMEQMGLKITSWKEEGGIITYDFVSDNGAKGNIVRLEDTYRGISIACNLEGRSQTPIIDASTLPEAVGKAINWIKTGNLN